jgi:hypothetical protein
MTLRDMEIIGGPPPVNLLKALAGDRHWNARLIPGVSKRSCILVSLAIREFLEAIGIAAEVRPVATLIRAYEGERQLHSLGIGQPLDPSPAPPKKWTGHMVTIAEGWLIDATLYPAL